MTHVFGFSNQAIKTLPSNFTCHHQNLNFIWLSTLIIHILKFHATIASAPKVGSALYYISESWGEGRPSSLHHKTIWLMFFSRGQSNLQRKRETNFYMTCRMAISLLAMPGQAQLPTILSCLTVVFDQKI